ncbi:MAG: class I adenylate-forming enzyme family protein [Acidimicrobiales bacterium]
MLSYAEAATQITAPGERFAISEVEIRGVPTKVFTNAASSLREVFDGARERGDDIFLVYEDERWTFSEVMRHVDALGSLLVRRYGVKKGDRVAIGMRNYPEWVISFAAAISVGAISVSLNAWWTEDELSFALEDSGTTVLISDSQRARLGAAACAKVGARIVVVRGDGDLPGGADRLEDVLVLGEAMPDADIGPDDDATILYTSGTTGRPKGAVSTHRAIVQSLLGFACRAALERLRRPDTPAPAGLPVFILIVPLFHVTGEVPVMLGCFSAGLKLVMMYKWDPERALQLIERERVTNFVGVPTQSWDLLESPNFATYDTSSLNAIGGGGAPAPPELVKRVASSFRKGGPSIGYGMTETNAYGPGNSGPDYLDHPTSTGRATPILDIEVRGADDIALPSGERGEIWFKGPHLIRGYWNRPDATAETIVDGWLRTGDIGRIDEDGFVYVEDRAKDMVLRGGENVYCAEVEAAIYEHPGVYEAAVFGIPHERLGEEVAAVVYARPGHVLLAEDIRAHVAQRLAGFKVPSKVTVVAEQLPRNAAGKILKRQLRDDLIG